MKEIVYFVIYRVEGKKYKILLVVVRKINE